ncbi:hypothetical protein JHK85_053949 [Glycine max]|nr:hypothetical protein JHK85_053949 [Glycine max]
MDATFATMNVTTNLVTKGIGSRNRTSSGFWGENTRGSFNMRFCTVQSHKSLKISSTQEFFEDGVVKREDLWITSKLRFYCLLTLLKIVMFLNVENGAVGVKPENVIQHDIPSTWRAMEELYDSGKAKAIGVTNFSSKKPQDLWDIAGVPPTVNQVECHPQWQQLKLHEFCASKEIHLSGFSPLGSKDFSTMICLRILLSILLLRNWGKHLHKYPFSGAYKWDNVLPKTSDEARIKENFDVFNWSIPEELIAKFTEIKQAIFHGPICQNPKANPKNVAIIILGEGAGTRLFPLTSTRAKQVVPIAGCYRIIDIPMSNCIKNGIRKVYVLTQFNSFYLNGHLCRSYNFGNGVNFGGGFVEGQSLGHELTECSTVRSAHDAGLTRDTLLTECNGKRRDDVTDEFDDRVSR